jgi:hypothetical protein
MQGAKSKNDAISIDWNSDRKKWKSPNGAVRFLNVIINSQKINDKTSKTAHFYQRMSPTRHIVWSDLNEW